MIAADWARGEACDEFKGSHCREPLGRQLRQLRQELAIFSDPAVYCPLNKPFLTNLGFRTLGEKMKIQTDFEIELDQIHKNVIELALSARAGLLRSM